MYQNYRFVEYTPRKCFKSFVQSSFDARRERIENPHSGVVAEMMKLLGNSSYGYQFMDRSRHSMITFNDFLRRYNNIEVVPSLESMPKMKMIKVYVIKNLTW